MYDSIFTTVKYKGKIIHKQHDKIHKYNCENIKEKRYNEGMIILKNYK
jgi:hypothetical protein